MATLDELLEADLSALEKDGLLRVVAEGEDSADLTDVCSNDYLGRAGSLVSRETLPVDRLGAGASRLVHGTHPSHRLLERDLAAWVGMGDALGFSSGYAANVGTLSALAGPDDLIVSDALNHASLIDGCRLARARVRVVPHLDLDAVAAALEQPSRRRWVVTESYFSMDGDSPDLRALRRICDRYQAFLILDEAHALGVFGPQGAGLAREAGISPDVLVGTLGKAVGLQGAFVAGSRSVVRWLWNRARSFVFSTGVSPWLARIARAAVEETRLDEAGRQRLLAHADLLDTQLHKAGVFLPPGRHGPIFPVIVGSNRAALQAQSRLREEGFNAQAIRPPTVPPESARLRITLRASLDRKDVLHLAEALGRAVARL